MPLATVILPMLTAAGIVPSPGSRRSRITILEDARAQVGLPPLPVPVGSPVPAVVPPPPAAQPPLSSVSAAIDAANADADNIDWSEVAALSDAAIPLSSNRPSLAGDTESGGSSVPPAPNRTQYQNIMRAAEHRRANVPVPPDDSGGLPESPPAIPARERRCSLHGCRRWCFIEAGGRIHDYCCRTHAVADAVAQSMAKKAADERISATRIASIAAAAEIAAAHIAPVAIATEVVNRPIGPIRGFPTVEALQAMAREVDEMAAAGLARPPSPPDPPVADPVAPRVTDRSWRQTALFGLSAGFNAIILVAAAAFAYTHLDSDHAAAYNSPIIAEIAAPFDDMGNKAAHSNLDLLVPCALFFALTSIGISSLLCRLSTLPGARIALNIHLRETYSSTRDARRFRDRVAAKHISALPHVSVHRTRRDTVRSQLKRNLLDIGPAWFSLFLFVEYLVSFALDYISRPMGLTYHPRALPRGDDLSFRFAVSQSWNVRNILFNLPWSFGFAIQRSARVSFV